MTDNEFRLLDEDCRQYIMLHIVLHISEFRI